MLIDWFTVGAQILNFLILVWLLKRFLYRPILDAVDAREQRIAKELADADAEKVGAGQEREEFQRKNAAFDKERAALLSQATEAANTERQRLLDAAHQETTDLSTRQRESLRNEAQELHQEIFRRTRQEVFAVARKALSDLAGATLEERMVATFIERLQALGTDAKQALSSTLLDNKGLPIVVRTACDLSVAQQSAIEAQLQVLLGADVPVRFETAEQLICGIELCTEGHKVAWSITHHLTEMENALDDLFDVKTSANPALGKDDADAH